MNGKTVVAGILGGLVLFFSGGLFYVLLMSDFFATAADKAEPLFVYIILGEVFLGILLAWVLAQTGATSLADGAKSGAMVGFLFALGMGFIMYGAYNFSDLTTHLVDVVVWDVRWAVAGSVAGWYLGRESAASA